MKTEFQAKYLQHLLKKKKKDEGFTLIELLVVVVIIGILAAIALPNLIGQISRARESDARNTLGAMNRSQQANHVETGQFSTVAGLKINSSSQYYDYAGGGQTSDFTAMTASAKGSAGDVKSYASGVAADTAGNYSFILCSTQAASTTAPTVTTTANCGSNYKLKQ